MKWRRGFGLALVIVGVAGCPPKEVEAPAEGGVEGQRVEAALAAPGLAGMGLTVGTYPRVDGSASTHVLNLLMAAKALGVGHQWAEASKWNAYSRTLMISGIVRDQPS